jgi:CheY-like chemotaxis protein
LRTGSAALTGRRILVVEDDFMIARLMAGVLEAAGAAIVGPAGSVKDSLALIAGGEGIDGAVLDVNLRGEAVYPVADVLQAKGVPIVFMTGYDKDEVLPRFADLPRLQKPMGLAQLVQALIA